MDFIDVGLYIMYLLIVVSAASAIILPAISAFNDPKSLKKAGLGIIALLAIFFVGYALSSNEPYPTMNVSEGVSKFIGGGLIAMYVLFVVSIIGIIYSEVSTFFK